MEEAFAEKMQGLIEEAENANTSQEGFYKILLGMKVQLEERLECAASDGVDLDSLW
jgi:hypothetical protein